jgi:hypothetical protein
MINRKSLILAIMCIIQMWSMPAFANQWITGTVNLLEDYGGANSGTIGILAGLGNKNWLTGDTSNGPTNCQSLFRIVVGFQNIDENSKNRMFSMLLTAYTTHSPISLFVDTSTSSNFCYVQMVAEGSNP